MIILTHNAIKSSAKINCMSNIPHDALKKLRLEAIDNYKHQETTIRTKIHKSTKENYVAREYG